MHRSPLRLTERRWNAAYIAGAIVIGHLITYPLELIPGLASCWGPTGWWRSSVLYL